MTSLSKGSIMVDNTHWKPYPFDPPRHQKTWGEEDLYNDLIELGYCYYVQFSEPGEYYSSRIAKRDKIFEWLDESGIEYDWIGGRSHYELVFTTEEDAIMFKLMYGV